MPRRKDRRINSCRVLRAVIALRRDDNDLTAKRDDYCAWNFGSWPVPRLASPGLSTFNPDRSMDEYHFLSTGESDTLRLGKALAGVLPAGTTVALMGTLGAGKTRLVQAIARHCGIAPDSVVSPTFVLCQEHHGDRTLYHMDAYRLQDDDEFLQLGPEEYFESDGITFLEWADRVADCLPPQRLEIHIDVVDDTSREFRFSARGESLAPVVQALRERLAEDA